MWISKVDDVMVNEKKDNIQIENNLLKLDVNDFNHFRTPIKSRNPIVQRTMINLSNISNDNAVIVSLSQKRVSIEATFAATAMSGVDESIFIAD